jgi:hypothetical protein
VWYLVPRLYKSFSFRYFSKPGLEKIINSASLLVIQVV